MKILLYFESESLIQTSGIGRAFEHQKAALTSAGIEYTTDPWDEDYDISSLRILQVGGAMLEDSLADKIITYQYIWFE